MREAPDAAAHIAPAASRGRPGPANYQVSAPGQMAPRGYLRGNRPAFDACTVARQSWRALRDRDPSRRRRRVRLVVLVCLLVPLFLALVSPLWFPWLVRQAAARFDVSIARAEARGFNRARFHDVRWSNPSVEIRIGTLETPQPLAWCARMLGSRSSAAAVVVDQWTAVIRERTEPRPETRGPISIGEVLERGVQGFDRLRWVSGTAFLMNGVIQAGERAIRIREAAIAHLGARMEFAAMDWNGYAAIEAANDGIVEFHVELNPWKLVAAGTVAPAGGDWRVDGHLGDPTNRVSFAATFARDGLIPATARLDGQDLRLRYLHPETPGTGITLTADLHARWRDGEGLVTVNASGETLHAGEATPVEARVHTRFTTSILELRQLQVASRPVRAALHEPVAIAWSELRTIPPATFDLQADLAQLPFPKLGLSGEVTAHVAALDVESRRVRFEVAARDLSARGFGVSSLDSRGELEGSLARIETLTATFPEGARLDASAEANLETRELLRGALDFRGVLPAIGSSNLLSGTAWRAAVTAAGPFTNLSGTLDAASLEPLRVPGMRPVSVAIAGSARGRELGKTALEVATDRGHLVVETTATLRTDDAGGRIHSTIETLRIERATGESPAFALGAPVPVTIAWREEPGAATGGTTNTTRLRAELGRLEGRGSAGNIGLEGSAEFPHQALARIDIRDFSADFLHDWLQAVPEQLTKLQLRHMEVAASWDPGQPLAATLRLAASAPVPELGMLSVEADARATPEGIVIPTLEIHPPQETGISATARVPVRVALRGDGADVQPLSAGTLAGEVEVPSEAWLWGWLRERFGVELSDPAVRIQLGGTAGDPRIAIAATASSARMTLPGADATPVEATDFEIAAMVSPREALVERAILRIEGQRVEATGRIPLKGGSLARGWADLRPADWREAEARVRIDDAEVAPLTRPWRETLQPSGVLSADMRWAGGALAGWLQASNLATRPLGSVGSLRDIHVRLGLDGETIRIQEGGATLNGQPILLSGWLNLPREGRLEGDVRVQGTNLTVLRSPEALVRADVDAGWSSTNAATPPRIAGLVRLHNSVVMLDVRDFVGVNLERPDQRPPYFSVDKDPFGGWDLDVHVRGEQFARVMSPAFRGTVSADLRLIGTLRNPRMLGAGMVDAGTIVFPFGQLRVSRMEVRFTESDPYEPHLDGSAEGLNFGYTVTMDLSGTLASPEIRFTTVPPMSTREALQMLTAGTLPRQEYAFTDAQRLQKVGTYLANDLISGLTGDPTSEPRLTFRSGQRVTTSGKLTYGAEYRLSDDWSLIGEYDRWSQFNAGVRWRVLEK